MPPDSLLIVSALALFAACIAAWRRAAALPAPARLPLRFAGMLLAALAAAAAAHLGDVAALLLLPLAGTALALASLARFARPLYSAAASTALVAALAGGLFATLSGHWLWALLPLAAASLTIIAAAFNGTALMPGLAGAVLLTAGLGLPVDGVGAGTLLLCAAAALGAVAGVPARSALGVEQQRLAGGGGGIGGVRQGFAMAVMGKGLTQDLRHE